MMALREFSRCDIEKHIKNTFLVGVSKEEAALSIIREKIKRSSSSGGVVESKWTGIWG